MGREAQMAKAVRQKVGAGLKMAILKLGRLLLQRMRQNGCRVRHEYRQPSVVSKPDAELESEKTRAVSRRQGRRCPDWDINNGSTAITAPAPDGVWSRVERNRVYR
jgi:hypothetical protein